MARPTTEGTLITTETRPRPPLRDRLREAGDQRRYVRSDSDVMFAGVAGGLGATWGVESTVVRIAFVLLSFCGGFGVFAYLVAWALSREPSEAEAVLKPPTVQQGAAFGFIVLGVVQLLREAGLWFGDNVGIPAIVVAIGASILYLRTDDTARPKWAIGRVGGLDLAVDRPSLARVLVGGVLVLGGVATFLAVSEGLSSIGSVALAVGVTTAGLALVFGPWVWRMASQLGAERTDRIRSEERAEMAAHLHDSVLQTLALIQRSAGDARKTVTLARRQERELRSWLYDTAAGAEHDRVEAAIEAIAQAAEEAYEVAVDVVVVGDHPMDDRTLALVHACREAVNNAALHAGVDEVSVYVEVEPRHLTAFVRDRGKGFDPASVGPERRGIADSIRGRLERHGGTVTITSAPGEGTEVAMRLPRSSG